MQHISSAQRSEIARLSRRGYTNTAIAEYFGVHRQTIGRNLRRLQWFGHQPDETALTREEVAEIRGLMARLRQPQGCPRCGEQIALGRDDALAESEPDEVPQW